MPVSRIVRKDKDNNDCLIPGLSATESMAVKLLSALDPQAQTVMVCDNFFASTSIRLFSYLKQQRGVDAIGTCRKNLIPSEWANRAQEKNKERRAWGTRLTKVVNGVLVMLWLDHTW